MEHNPYLRCGFLLCVPLELRKEIISVIKEKKGDSLLGFKKKKTEFGQTKEKQTFLTGRRLGDNQISAKGRIATRTKD